MPRLTHLCPGTDRIPNFLTSDTLIEVKNAYSVPLTPQIQDMMMWSIQNGRAFHLWVRNGAQLSPSLTSAINAGLIDVRWFNWP